MGCESLSMALAIVLLLEPRLSLACLQCDPNFASHFSSYAPKLSRKSWGLGVVPAAGRRLRGWAQDTLKELNLKIAPDIRELSPKQGWPIYLFLLGIKQSSVLDSPNQCITRVADSFWLIEPGYLVLPFSYESLDLSLPNIVAQSKRRLHQLDFCLLQATVFLGV